MNDLETIGRDLGAYFTADELLATHFPDPRWAVEGLIPEGLTLLAGAPKLGKSWLALGLSLAIAAEGYALGKIPTQGGNVLYCALEDTPRRIKSRLTKMLDGTVAPPRLAVMTNLPTMPRATDLISGWLEDHPEARLVVVDVLGKIRPMSAANADRYEGDYKVVGELKRLADAHRVAVVLVTHVRKMADGDVFNMVSGSTGLTGAADTTIVLARARGDHGASLHITGRDVEESEYALTFDPTLGAWTLDGDALQDAAQRASEKKTSVGLGDRSAEIVRIVGQNPQGIGPTALAIALGIEPKDAGNYLLRLEKGGRIAKAGRGLYTPVETVETVETSPQSGSGFDTLDGFDTPSEGEVA
ncbi:AAA family ATPase [Cellulosimicrobium funkei]|uniref:AAA family ATPase n=1 Tax=Cellulosimicrobium funkei TaxID=264251 RepID=A0A4Y8QYD5_9MICO|nr:AAA family ATPase [Cellulosimicrobium funkei]TFF03726.1 AAA family ATPase [Cellulosimicrobium funkei]TGA67362.1 AAA family ATPase [Cellulosimicrobium terreum]